MLDYYDASCELSGNSIEVQNLNKACGIVNQLLSKNSDDWRAETEKAVLDKDFPISSVQKLPIKPAIIPIIKERLEEVQRALKAGANLSNVILCGSILEAALASVAGDR